MRMSRRLGMYVAGELVILDEEVIEQASSYYRRYDSNPDHDEWTVGPAVSWSETADLSGYTHVHFTVTHQNDSSYVSVGSVKAQNPSVGEVDLDISSIADRSALEVKVGADEARASRPGFYPATNTVYNEITVTKIWATK